MRPHENNLTDSFLDVSQHADVVDLVIHPTAALAGLPADHRQAMHQLNTLALPLSHISRIITKHHRYILLLSQTKVITTKAKNKTRVISGANSKVWSCSSRKVPTRRVVESLSIITRPL